VLISICLVLCAVPPSPLLALWYFGTYSPRQMLVCHWQCQADKCKKVVEYDGSRDGIFSFRRRNTDKKWLLFTRGLVEKIVSFVISARSTYTASTRHLSSDVQSFSLRRKDVVKVGTAAMRTLKGATTRTDHLKWRAKQIKGQTLEEDDPLVSIEHFAGIDRVRPAMKDSVAAKRRVRYRGRERHAADREGYGDSCNKALSVFCDLTQGVFSIVCPHVITLGFRCMFRAESVGEALSIILERFPKLPQTIFYDVACKLDKNAMRRVRPILRAHGVRCLLYRPHSITHTCSPIYVPDDSLGSTAGVAMQAAEVSHSIAVGNRTSLAYMLPATYMTQKMVQVAFMNMSKLYRLESDNSSGEKDHVNLGPFFHSRLEGGCKRSSFCSCKYTSHMGGRAATAVVLLEPGAPNRELDARAFVGDGVLDDEEGVLPRIPTNAADVPSGGMLIYSRGARSRREPSSAAVAQASQPSSPADGSRLDGEVTTSSLLPGADGGSVAAGDNSAEEGDGVCAQGSPVTVTGVENAFAPLSMLPFSKEETSHLDAVTKGNIRSARVRPINNGKISLTVADVRRLFGEAWLNDEIINSFVALVTDRDSLARSWQTAAPLKPAGVPAGALRSPSLPLTFIFNTYLHARLSERVGQ